MSQQIRVSQKFSKTSNAEVVGDAQAVYTGMNGSTAFSDAPVAMVTLKTDTDNLSASIIAASDGSRKAIAARNKCRVILKGDLQLLGVYAAKKSNGDMEMFLSSGFRAAAPRTQGTAQALNKPVIKGIEQGVTGQLLASVKSDAKASSNELHYAPITNGAPGVWTSFGFAKSRKPIAVNNLTPGTIYAIQVRSLGPLGYTDWSDTATRMCI